MYIFLAAQCCVNLIATSCSLYQSNLTVRRATWTSISLESIRVRERRDSCAMTAANFLPLSRLSPITPQRTCVRNVSRQYFASLYHIEKTIEFKQRKSPTLNSFNQYIFNHVPNTMWAHLCFCDNQDSWLSQWQLKEVEATLSRRSWRHTTGATFAGKTDNC